MGKYIDVFIQPIPKKKVTEYRKTTKQIGKILMDHGALASRDYVAEDSNATKDSFPKKIKLKTGEVLIFAVAEFKSKAHREKVFKAMSKDPRMKKIQMNSDYMDHKRAVVGGFSMLVNMQ